MKSNSLRYAVLSAIGAATLLLTNPANAGLSVIPNPDAVYQGRTTRIDILGADGSDITGIADAQLSINFSAIREIHTVPGGGWSSWSSPPDSESATPRVLTADNYDPTATSLTLTFSQPLTTFGAEAEPDPFEIHTIRADFFNGLVLVGSISIDANGDTGSRLFAADATGGDVFTSVVFSSDVDFAIAQLRYTVVPEPSTWAMMSLGAILLVGLIQIRRRVSS